jgi:hypothetical protein
VGQFCLIPNLTPIFHKPGVLMPPYHQIRYKQDHRGQQCHDLSTGLGWGLRTQMAQEVHFHSEKGCITKKGVFFMTLLDTNFGH